MKKFDVKSRKSRRGGFTLIELVMVIMILAIVAGLAVPLVGWLRRSANYSAQAHSTGALSANLELYRTTYGNNGYPDNLDSLLLSTDNTAVIDYVDGGWGDLFSAGQITGDALSCLNWLSAVYDHTDDAHSPNAAGDPQVLQGNPGNTAIYRRTKVAADFPVALVNVANGDEGFELMSELYPDATNLGTASAGADAAGSFTHGGETIVLVAFGIGQGNEAVGRTMVSAPLDPRVDNSKVYGRYAAIFAVYPNRAGRRAQLKAIVNAKGRTTNNALTEFWQSTNPE